MTIVHETHEACASRPRVPRLGDRIRQESPYAIACAWCDADPRVRLPRSRQAAAAYKAISLLPRAWGEELDRLGAGHEELRWLAGTSGHAYAAAREARYRALVGLLRSPPLEGRRAGFERIRDELPKMRQPRRRAG